MNAFDWFMVVVGLVGAVFLGVGISCWLDPFVDRWLERRLARRSVRAAMWRWK